MFKINFTEIKSGKKNKITESFYRNFNNCLKFTTKIKNRKVHQRNEEVAFIYLHNNITL